MSLVLHTLKLLINLTDVYHMIQRGVMLHWSVAAFDGCFLSKDIVVVGKYLSDNIIMLTDLAE